ncbi:hypothetical protein CCY99_05595 [Helicobacter sp. 16-1353]|uniref:nitrous oxide reductase accessory protein NosL n=1 Tax=Helicobacter sp. 16-1353 TaxID=2004996 RepID=UPI000DCF510A|nr:nitrous oxide reductase accessory protein NosL [Helicobacter sp. 16-1353]RAX53855.1 hypothetical protein CCY99_05595 [Helicobacter sp. 16-1353]
MKFILIFVLAIFAFAEEYCEICGMNLNHHKHTNHRLINKNKVVETCSLHCIYDIIIRDSANKYTIQGFDNTNGEFKNLKDLLYVVGSDKKGTMTSESEFAFSSKEKANNFIKDNGGRIIQGKDILEYTKNKFDKDKQILESNQAKIAALGEKIAQKYCNIKELEKIRIEAKNIAEFKTKAKGSCNNIDGKGLQAVSLYFWKKQ